MEYVGLLQLVLHIVPIIFGKKTKNTKQGNKEKTF